MVEERFSDARLAFWAGLIGVLAGLAAAGVGFWLLRRPLPTPLTLEPPPTRTPVVWLVHVAGAVATPGVYPLPPGSRVQDAIAAAGGLLPDADAAALNLAARLDDGVRVWVPRKGAAEPPSGPTASGSIVTTPTVAPSFQVDINQADVTELDMLPGIGPALAQRIVEYRREHGPFQRVEDLLQVRGIGPAKLEQLRPYITVGTCSTATCP